MGDNSKIEWTEATWNPIVGCSIVSPGCTNCYAMTFAGNRLDGNPKTPHYAGTTQKSKAGPVWTGKVALAPESKLLEPLRWKRSRMIFVNSMGDLFHESVPDAWIDQVFAVMALCPQHTFQVLTKRAERIRDYVSNGHDGTLEAARLLSQNMSDRFRDRPIFWPLPNVWLGVSAEDQRRADERIPHLLETPAAVRFVSAEPLLGLINLGMIACPDRAGWLCPLSGEHQLQPAHADHRGTHLDWIIVGGESGSGARPMHPDWARSIRDQCQAAGVPFFFKQWGEWCPTESEDQPVYKGEHRYLGNHVHAFRTGKRHAGRQLDGREHNEMPERAS
jgi:protein gp37